MFSPYSSIVFICFSNALLRGEYVNLVCLIILIWSDGKISSPVRYSYSSIFPDKADIFAASLLISYFSFSSLILSSFVVINFYIVSKRFFLKRKELSDERVVSITKKRIWFCSRLFIKIHKVLGVNIWLIIKCNFLNFSFVWNFHDKIVCWI